MMLPDDYFRPSGRNGGSRAKRAVDSRKVDLLAEQDTAWPQINHHARRNNTTERSFVDSVVAMVLKWFWSEVFIEMVYITNMEKQQNQVSIKLGKSKLCSWIGVSAPTFYFLPSSYLSGVLRNYMYHKKPDRPGAMLVLSPP